ncbi:MAG: amino acid adenylation domain-containing protein, partial [Blastocatellia bacterium]
MPQNASELYPPGDSAITLVDLLQLRALHQPARIAYTYLGDGDTQEASLTYEELDNKAKIIAATLKHHGREGERAILLYPPGLDFTAAFFGCLYAGVIAVPAYPPDPSRPQRTLARLQAIIADAKASFALTTSSLLSLAKPLLSRFEDETSLMWISTDTLIETASDWQKPLLGCHDLAFLQYTSGSTSSPKGVMLTHANLLHNASMVFSAVEHGSDDLYVSWLPIFHDMGFMAGILQPLFAGIPAVLMSPLAFLHSPIRWLNAISKYKATTSGAPNFAYDLCVRKISEQQRAHLDLSSWSVAFNGAEPIRRATIDEFTKAFEPCGFRKEAFYPCYGLAEATLIVTGGQKSSPPIIKSIDSRALACNRVGVDAEDKSDARDFVGCGEPLLDTEIIIVNPDTLSRCAPEEVGEIWVSGPSVARGYWNSTEQTEQTFSAYLNDSGEGPFLRTGDLGFLTDGELFITGRLKDLIIIRGLNHYPQDIEISVEHCHWALRPGCGAAFSIEADGEEGLVIVQELDPVAQADSHRIAELIRQAVAEQHDLAVHALSLIKPGTIQKTSSGKIRRRSCRDDFLNDKLQYLFKREWAGLSQQEPHRQVSGHDLKEEIQIEKEEAQIETWLVRYICEKLKVDHSDIEINESITRYGLDSLLSIELAHDFEQRFGLALPMSFILQGASIAEIAARFSSNVALDSGSKVAEITGSDDEGLVFPLSQGQRSLWFLQQLAPTSAAYNIVNLVRLNGELDVAALHQAFQSLTDRHGALRTSFTDSDSGPLQLSHKSVPAAFDEVKIADWNDDLLTSKLIEESYRPFDLTAAPLMRIKLFTKNEREHLMLLVIHHIIADFWSLTILLQELEELYLAKLESRKAALPPVSVRYGAYVRWQQNLLQSDEGERLWKYWQARLGEQLPQLDIPFARPRSRLQSYRGASEGLKLDSELTLSIKELAQARNVTLYTFLLAAFQILLYRYSGQKEIVVGSPTAGRSHAEFANVVGYFVNPIVLRTKLAPDQTFGALLSELRLSVLEAFDHQDYPFGLLVERLQPKRDLDRSPLFQVMFVLQKAQANSDEQLSFFAVGRPGAKVKFGPLELESVAIAQQMSKLDLTVMVAEVDGELSAQIEYSTDLFGAEVIRRMLGHFRCLLSSICSEPDLRIGSLELLTPSEKQQLIEWNDTETEHDPIPAIHHFIEAQAGQLPDAVALSFRQKQISYACLNSEANRLAHFLINSGVGPESIVLVCCDRSIEMLVALLAVLKAGAAYLPLDPAYPAMRRLFILEEANPSFILTQSHFEHLFSESTLPVFCLDTQRKELSSFSESIPHVDIGGDNLAYVIFTSGSTGNPKGAMNNHRAISNRLLWMQNYLNLTASDVVIQKTPYSFDVSVWELFSPLMAGARLVIAEPGGHQDASYINELICQQNTTVIHFVPSMLGLFLREPRAGNCTTLRAVVCSGEALSTDLQDRFFERLPASLFNLYGPTEAAVDVTSWQCSSDSKSPTVSIGKPIANINIHLLDENLSQVPVGVPAELMISGVGLGRGYLKRPDLTSERFIADPHSAHPGARMYRTGDLARYLPDGNIEFLNRIDHQVKIRGVRIELGEIEEVLREHPEVSDCVVTAKDSVGAEKRLVAYVVPRLPGKFKISLLRAHLKDKLPDYMLPLLVVMNSLPLNSNGKVDRKSLPDPDRSRPEFEHAYCEPQTDTQKKLVRLWESILGVERVGIRDNFFELGGHSLLATRVISRVRDMFQVSLPIRSLFERPAIESFSVLIDETPGRQQSASLPVLRRREAEAREKLSYAQQRLWFFEQLEPGTPVYNIPVALRLTGSLNIAALEACLNRLIRRHEILRTCFQTIRATPLQRVVDSYNLGLAMVDLTALEDEARAEQSRRVAEAEARRGFDLSRLPLIRARIVKQGVDESVLIVVMHHIITDGWSMGVMIREIVDNYEAMIEGRINEQEELEIQYGDYAAWQREWQEGEVESEQLEYWKKQLEGVGGVNEIGTDKGRRGGRSREGRVRQRELSREAVKAIEEMSQREEATKYQVMLAGFVEMMRRYGQSEEVVVGTPVAGRKDVEVEKLIGFFVNTVVMRVRLDRKDTFRQLLEKVKDITLSGYMNDDVPFEKVVEELQIERSLSYHPIFQMMFAFQNEEVKDIRLAGLRMQEERIENHTTKFDLTLSIREKDETMVCAMQYSTSLYEAATIRRMLRQYEMVLRAAPLYPDTPLFDLPVLTEEELQQVILEWNDTRADYPQSTCLHHLVEAQVERAPDAVALSSEEGQFSYLELNRRANQLAHFIRELGAGPDVFIGACFERSANLVISLLAILKAGAAYVPLDPEYPEQRLAYILRDSAIELVLTEQKFAGLCIGDRAQTICIESEWNEIGKRIETGASDIVGPDNLAYVIYTSGSTGFPKGVMIQHRAICNHLLFRQSQYPLDRHERFLQKASSSFDISVWEIFGTLMAGARLVLAEPHGEQDPAYLARFCSSREVTVAHFSPSMLQLFLDQPELEGNKLARVFCGGEPLSRKLMDHFFSRLSAELISQYGPTEATVDVTFARCSADWSRENAAIGRPIANTRIYLCDLMLHPVPIGVTGEIVVGGECLSRGYLNRADMTAEKFIPNPFGVEPGTRLYRTGDLARHLPDGNIEFVGRSDHQVKVRGYRVETGEIEATIISHPSVHECVVTSHKDSSGNNSLAAYVVPESPVGIADLRAYLKARLPHYMMPAAFILLDAMPLTVSGKLDRKALPEPDLKWSDSVDGYDAPRASVEEVLAEIWSDVLQVERVGIYDNFFELGGHSLLAVQIVSRVQEAFGINFALRTMFEHPLLADQGKIIEDGIRNRQGIKMPGLIRRERGGRFPLSFAQQRLWLLDQMEPDSPFYNVSGGVRLVGTLDSAALERSFNHLISRHEALRTKFLAFDGEPFQFIEPALQLRIPITDLRRFDEPFREAEALRLAIEEGQQPFDLSRAPLLRVHLFQMAEQYHIMVFTIHHIISDEWSTGILAKELSFFYGAQLVEDDARLPELSFQYVDYAQWQRDWLDKGVLDLQLDYWKQQLAGAATLLDLPSDRPRPDLQTFSGARHPVALPQWLINELKLFGRREKATPFMTLLTLYFALLYRYTSQQDILVGAPVANRSPIETETIIGFFVNTLVMRASLKDNPSFTDLLRRVREMAFGAYANRDLPFERLIEDLNPERSLSHQPMFQVMFVLQTDHGQNFRLSGLSASFLEVDTQSSKFDLMLSVHETEDGLHGWFEYNTDLFDGVTIDRMSRHLRQMASAIIAAPKRPLFDLTLLTRPERHQLIFEFNDTHETFISASLAHELFEQQAERTPDGVALIFEDEQISYGLLNERANKLAHYLHRLGIGPESRVGICLERSPQMIIGLLATLKAGGAYVPLDPAYPKTRLSAIIEDARPRALLTETHLLPQLPETLADIVCISREWGEIERQTASNLQTSISEDNLTYLIYTSGSTGKPKGVALSHGSLCNLIAFQLAVSIAQTSRATTTMQFAPLSFDVSFQEIFSTLASGGKLLMVSEHVRRDALNLLQLVRNHSVERMFLPFVALQQIAEVAYNLDADSFALREVITAGEQLQISRQVESLFRQLKTCRLYNQYGPSETHVVSAYPLSPVVSDWAMLPPIGRPIANSQLYILDNHLNPTPSGVPGQLFIGGRNVARCYLDKPDMTAERFIPDQYGPTPGARLYESGDLARLLPDGNIQFLGRIDHQVKVRGFRIEPGEIEVVLNQHPLIHEAVVTVARDQNGGNRLVAYVVPNSDIRPSARDLRSFIGERLPDYMIPSAYMALDALPLTSSGKVDRRSLPACSPEQQTEEVSVSGPETFASEIIGNIWRNVLGVERVESHDNFFDLGGHSLLATRVVSRVRQALGIDLTMKSLFEHPILESLSVFAEQKLKGLHRSKIPPIRKGEAEAREKLSYAQQRLWFFEQLEPGTPVYNIPVALRLTGSLNIVALEACLNRLIRRHEILRTCFQTIRATPLQRVVDSYNLGLAMVDLTALEDEARAEQSRRVAEAEARRGFDLSRLPLIRARIVKQGVDESVLIVVMHHIITDGWSMGVMIREIVDNYEAMIAGRINVQEELEIQYGDYAAWQREWQEGGVETEQLEYWKKQLEGVGGVNEIGTDKGRRGSRSREGRVKQRGLSREAVKAIEEMSQREEATKYQVMLAGFVEMMRRYGQGEEVVVGTPVAGRKDVEVEKLIGFFVNTVVMRVKVRGEERFEGLVRRVREVSLEAYANEDVPFERVVEEVRPERGMSHGPIYELMFAINNTPEEKMEMRGVKIEREKVRSGTAKNDLTMVVEWRREGEKSVSVEYREELYEEETIERMLRQYERLMEQAAEGKRCWEMEMMTEEEKREVVRGWNETGRKYGEEGSVIEEFEKEAGKRADAIAIESERGIVSYGELNRRSEEIGRQLRRRGVREEEVVGVWMRRGEEMIESLMGVMKAGGVYVPIEEKSPSERVEYVIRETGMKVIMVDEERRGRVKVEGVEEISREEWKGEKQRGGDAGIERKVEG